MRFPRADRLTVVVPRAALDVVFDECDRFDADETGGRVLGTYADDQNGLRIDVSAIIGPGPRARRTSVSFFQDGEYQERLFREIEMRHRTIEHLGNWHTHHVNGLQHLSPGDITTYKRTVNHSNHNTAFFYAMLVVSKRPGRAAHERYAVNHYLLRRDDDEVYEIPSSSVELVDHPLVWSPKLATERAEQEGSRHQRPRRIGSQRVCDRDVLAEFFPGLRPYTSRGISLYWRGPVHLIDGTQVEVVLVEDASSSPEAYSAVLRAPPVLLKGAAEQIAAQQFPSARTAAMTIERACNRALHECLRQRPSGDARKRSR